MAFTFAEKMSVPKERINLLGMAVAVAFVVLSFVTLNHYQDYLENSTVVLTGGGVFLGFFAILASSQMMSGYTWRNRVPWNNGIRRKDDPKKFWTEITLEFGFGLFIFGLCIASVANGWTN